MAPIDKVAGRSERPALLSNKELDLLERSRSVKSLQQERDRLQKAYDAGGLTDRTRIREISKELAEISRGLSTLVRSLAIRMLRLEEDLHTIIKSPALKPLVAVLSQNVDDITFAWHEIHRPTVGYNYACWQVKKVVGEKSGNDLSQNRSRKTTFYWLDTKIEPKPTIKDIFKPEYAISGIRNKSWVRTGLGKVSVRGILIEAVQLDYRFQEHASMGLVERILPIKEKEATDIYAIYKAIAELKKALRDKQQLISELDSATFKNLQRQTGKL